MAGSETVLRFLGLGGRSMPGVSPKRPRYRFGPFELDPAEGTLSRNGTRVRLQDLPYRLLVMLVERPGEIITREEVRQRLWPENTFVEFDNSLGVAIRKIRDSLADDAEAPRYVETIPRRGYRFLAPVTVQDQPAEKVTGRVAASARLRSHSWVVAALVLVLVGGAVSWFRSAPRHPSTKAEAGSVAPPVRVRRSVAVLGFRNLPGRPEDNWLSPVFAEMLNTELAAGGGLRMVSGEDVARAKRELPLTDEDSLAKATLERLRSTAHADVVVLGSYTLLPNPGGNRIRLDVRLQDTARGDTIAEEAVTGDENNLFELATQAGARLRQSLGVSPISTEGANAARATVPANQEAVRFYTEGLTKLWAFDYMQARDLLLKAVAADPNFPLTHAALADAWDHLGYGSKSRAEAERALALSEHMPEEERLLIEGQYRYTLQDWPRAVETYRKLFNQFPDNLDYGLRLSTVQRWVTPADSLRTLAALRQLPPPAGDDPRIDLNEAQAWINQDAVKAQAAAKHAIEKGVAQGSHLLVGRAYGILCQTLANGSSTEETIHSCENARQAYAAAGDHDNEARTLSDFAALYYQLGDLARAEAMFREAARVFREVGDLEGVATTSNNLGDVFLMRGNLSEAKKLLEQSIPNYQAIESKNGLALVLNDLGDLSRLKGDLETAQTTYQQAKATAREIDDKRTVAYVLTGVGDLLTDRGDLAAARKSYEESLAMRNQAGEKQAADETQVALAQLAIEEGHAADAEAAMRPCKQQFHQEQQADDELTAGAVLAQALLAQGKYAEAQKEVEGDESLAAKSQNRFTRLQFDLTAARVKSGSSHPESSRAQLERILQDAHAHGFLGVEFEARLALAELERKMGHNAAAQIQFGSLERSAHAKGFGLIARKASAARS